MKIADVISIIEDFAPLSLQESWDNSGLNVGNAEREVTGIVVSFDCTPEVIDFAWANNCNLIVTHHPLIFSPLRSVRSDSGASLVEQMVADLLRNDISLYATHTPSDKVPQGVSALMASRLGLQDLEFLDTTDGLSGLGMVGNLPEAMTPEQFAHKLKEAFKLKVVRTSPLIEGPISRVALCGGSGSSLIELARSKGAQAYVTGDVSYHHFFTKNDFMIFDIGHWEGEVEIIDLLFSKIYNEISTNFVNFVIPILRYKNVNPVNYL